MDSQIIAANALSVNPDYRISDNSGSPQSPAHQPPIEAKLLAFVRDALLITTGQGQEVSR